MKAIVLLSFLFVCAMGIAQTNSQARKFAIINPNHAYVVDGQRCFNADSVLNALSPGEIKSIKIVAYNGFYKKYAGKGTDVIFFVKTKKKKRDTTEVSNNMVLSTKE